MRNYLWMWVVGVTGILASAVVSWAGEPSMQVPARSQWSHGALICEDFSRDGRRIMRKEIFQENGFTTTIYSIIDPQEQQVLREQGALPRPLVIFQIVFEAYRDGRKIITKQGGGGGDVLVHLVDRDGDGKDDVLRVIRSKVMSKGRMDVTLIEAYDLTTPGKVAPLSAKDFAAEKREVDMHSSDVTKPRQTEEKISPPQ